MLRGLELYEHCVAVADLLDPSQNHQPFQCGCLCTFTASVLLQPACWCCIWVPSRVSTGPCPPCVLPDLTLLCGLESPNHVCPVALHLIGVLHLHLSFRCSISPCDVELLLPTVPVASPFSAAPDASSILPLLLLFPFFGFRSVLLTYLPEPQKAVDLPPQTQSFRRNMSAFCAVRPSPRSSSICTFFILASAGLSWLSPPSISTRALLSCLISLTLIDSVLAFS